MKNLLTLLFVCAACAVHAQSVVTPRDYSAIINSKQVQDKMAAMMPKSFTPENAVTVQCGDMKAFVDPTFGKVEFSRYNNSTILEKYVCGMNAQNQRTCNQDYLKGKLHWVPCDQSCPPADWNMDSCPLKPEMQKAMYGSVLQPKQDGGDPYQ